MAIERRTSQARGRRGTARGLAPTGGGQASAASAGV